MAYRWFDGSPSERLVAAAYGGAGPALACPMQGAFWQLDPSSNTSGVSPIPSANVADNDYDTGYMTPNDYMGYDVSAVMVPLEGVVYEAVGGGRLRVPPGLYFAEVDCWMTPSAALSGATFGRVMLSGDIPGTPNAVVSGPFGNSSDMYGTLTTIFPIFPVEGATDGVLQVSARIENGSGADITFSGYFIFLTLIRIGSIG